MAKMAGESVKRCDTRTSLTLSPKAGARALVGRKRTQIGAVEQHPQAILAISHHAVVLDQGSVVHSGTAQALREQPERLDRLLGVAARAH